MSQELASAVSQSVVPPDFGLDGSLAALDSEIFVSYRSHNSNVVRQVVERFMSAGIPVWFAEYRILLIDRGQFRELYLGGLQRSRQALIFTSPAYFESEWCRDELRQIRAKQQAFIEVEISSSVVPEEFRWLRDDPTSRVCFSDGNSKLVDFILKRWGIGLAIPEPLQPSRYNRIPLPMNVPSISGDSLTDSKMTELSIDYGDWQLGQSRTDGFNRHFSATQSTPFPMKFAVSVGPDLPNRGFQHVLPSDDKTMFEELAAYADSYLNESDDFQMKCIGAHLKHHAGRGHFAVTYWFGKAGCWSRKYSILLSPPNRSPVEVALTFHVWGTFQDFCRATPLFDEVADSLLWSPSLYDVFGTRLPLIVGVFLAPMPLIAILSYWTVFRTFPFGVLLAGIAGLCGWAASLPVTASLITWLSRQNRRKV